MTLEYTHTPVTVDGQTAVVVGGTSGIGRAIALGFAAEGADVVAASRDPDSVAETAAELRERGAETIERTCDATDRVDLASLRDDVVAELGGVDVLVYSASAIARSSVADVTDAEWDHVFDVQLKGAVRATQLFAEVIDGGAILHVASASATMAIPNVAAYATAKGGLDSFVRVAADELGPAVRVNAVRPGFVRTAQTGDTYTDGDPRYETIKDRTTQSRLARPEEVVGAAVYLASDAASYTTGEIVTIDDGFTAATFEA